MGVTRASDKSCGVWDPQETLHVTGKSSIVFLLLFAAVLFHWFSERNGRDAHLHASCGAGENSRENLEPSAPDPSGLIGSLR